MIPKCYSAIAILAIGFMCMLSIPLPVYAGDTGLEFPTNEEAITEAFKKKDVRTRGIRTRGLRGVSTIVEDKKVGAMIHFDLNSAVIRSESYKLLDEFGKAFNKGLKDQHFEIAGHTDSSGSDEYNYQLSLQRAKAVTNYLVGRHNLDASRFSVAGYGERQPIEDNATPIGRSRNRRVEFLCR